MNFGSVDSPGVVKALNRLADSLKSVEIPQPIPDPDHFVCPKCFHSLPALFLYVKHMRDRHGENLAPLARQEGA